MSAAVEVRSNSRISGRISVATVTCVLGQRSRITAAAAASLASLAYPLRKDTHTDGQPVSIRVSTAARTASRSTGVSMVPSANVRSGTPSRTSREITGVKVPQRPQVRGRSRRRISSTSVNPWVVIRPAGAPVRSRSALVPTVVPWTMAPSRRRSGSPVVTPLMNPSASAARVDGTLATRNPPSSSSTKTSVNVPPTSMPRAELTAVPPGPPRRRRGRGRRSRSRAPGRPRPPRGRARRAVRTHHHPVTRCGRCRPAAA